MISPWLIIGISSYIPYHLRDLRCLCNNKIMYTLRRLSYCAFDKCYTWKTLIMAMCVLASYAYANNIIHTKMHVSGYYNGSWLRFCVNIFSNFGISLVVKRRFHWFLFIICHQFNSSDLNRPSVVLKLRGNRFQNDIVVKFAIISLWPCKYRYAGKWRCCYTARCLGILTMLLKRSK